MLYLIQARPKAGVPEFKLQSEEDWFMKKIILLLSLVFVLGFSAVCAAASAASILGNEEKAVDKFVAALNKNTGVYEKASPVFTPGLQKKINNAAFQKLQTQFADSFGDLKEKKLVLLEKFDQGDRVTYLAGFSKTKVVKMVFAFDVKGEKPLMNDFGFYPVEIKPAE